MLGIGLLERNCTEKELGVMVDSKLSVREQCALVVKRANGMLRYLKKGVTRMSSEIVLPLYSSLLRACLEYCIYFRALQLKRHRITAGWSSTEE